MSVTRDERIAVLARRMQGVFDVRWEPGVAAGDAFSAARDALIRQLEIDLELAHQVTFCQFSDRYLPPDVKAETIKTG